MAVWLYSKLRTPWNIRLSRGSSLDVLPVRTPVEGVQIAAKVLSLYPILSITSTGHDFHRSPRLELSGRRPTIRRGRFHSFRFQRRIRVLPGVHVNLSLSGIGVSVGPRGLHAGVTARGQRYVSAGLPGTGLSVRQYSPVNGSPRLSFWPLVIAAAILAVLLAVAVR